jgi:hypothetical protein
MYLPLTTTAYFVYGKKVEPNILQMSTGVINQVVEVMITIHLLLALLIVINPVCQELESLARVPKRKGDNHKQLVPHGKMELAPIVLYFSTSIDTNIVM